MARSGGQHGGPMSCMLALRGTAPGAYPAFRQQVRGEEHLCSLPGARLHGGRLFQTCCEASCPGSYYFPPTGAFICICCAASEPMCGNNIFFLFAESGIPGCLTPTCLGIPVTRY